MRQYSITCIFVIKFLQDFTFGKSMQGSTRPQGITHTLLGVQSRRVFFYVVSFECRTKGNHKIDGGCGGTQVFFGATYIFGRHVEQAFSTGTCFLFITWSTRAYQEH
ncbi:hypothetical protein M404DRAFT_1009445, partial [Pisolithus tinctorius Marx 270]